MPETKVNGCTLWYELKGEGEYLLQIGGAGFAHENFGLVTEQMAEEFNVIDFDLRGYGLSERPEQEYSMELWADDIAALFDDIGIKSAHVHGTSMGGMVALALAARHPQKVNKMILSCAMAYGDTTQNAHMDVWKALAQAYGMGGEPLAQLIATHCLSRKFLDSSEGLPTVENIRQVLERNCSVPVFCSALDAVKKVDFRGDVPKIRQETLVMDGDEDILTPLDQGPSGAGNRWLAENLPNGELYIVKGSAHTNLMEMPDLSARVCIAFLKGEALPVE